jgi:hypothetical protein
MDWEKTSVARKAQLTNVCARLLLSSHPSQRLNVLKSTHLNSDEIDAAEVGPSAAPSLTSCRR